MPAAGAVVWGGWGRDYGGRKSILLGAVARVVYLGVMWACPLWTRAQHHLALLEHPSKLATVKNKHITNPSALPYKDPMGPDPRDE